jgi:hypothetical protein
MSSPGDHRDRPAEDPDELGDGSKPARHSTGAPLPAADTRRDGPPDRPAFHVPTAPESDERGGEDDDTTIPPRATGAETEDDDA